MNATSGINPTTEARSRASGMRGADQRERLRVVAQEFESLLMNTLMRSMRETVPQSDLIDNEGEIRFYNQMFAFINFLSHETFVSEDWRDSFCITEKVCDILDYLENNT